MANWGGLPSIVSQIPNDLRNFLQRVKESMDGYMTGPDRFVRISELKSTNIISVDALGNVTGAGAATTNTATGGTTGSTGGTAGGTTVAIDYTPPPPPTGLAATGAITSIILTWDAPVGYTNLSHIEIWRADVNDIGVAVMVGTSLGDMYTDPVGPSMTKYYWIRFISKASIPGQYNAIAGVLGQTSVDPAPLIDLLTVHGIYTNTPFFYQATPTTINGVAVPAGTYVRDAFIANGTISNAKIGNLAVDNAKIANMAVDKLTAGSLAASQYIQSSNYVAGITGFRVNADGSAEFSNITARGNIQATSFSQITLDANQHIKYGQTAYNTGTGFFLGDNGAGVPVFSLGVAGGSGLVWNGTSLAINGGGTFSGALSAATGSFAGSLSAATGTFAGSLSAATGTFSGALSAATGTFSGSLSAATGTFSGSLTAAAVNAVDTINLAGQAVTIPVGVSTSTAVAVSSGVWTNVLSASITSTGAPIMVIAGASGSASSSVGDSRTLFRIIRTGFGSNSADCAFVRGPDPTGQSGGGAGTAWGYGSGCIAVKDTPGVGTFTYTLQGMTTGGGGSITSCGFQLLEVKR